MSNEEEIDSLPTSLEAEDFIYDSPNEHRPPTQNEKNETLNLLRGYQHLKNELKKIPQNERHSFLGIIDVETCIKACHKVLMTNLLDKSKTAPGKFSTLPRSVEFEGKYYLYPSYQTEEIAFDAVQAIVDKYNEMISEISAIEDEKEKLTNSFKCASLLLFSFLTLHPFSD